MHQEGGRLYCWGRRQSEGCRARGIRQETAEMQMGAYLRSLSLPEDTRRRILAAYHKARPETAERDRQRQALEGQLQRLGDLFVLGELPRGEYEARRASLRTELGRLAEAEGHGHPEVLERLERYLLNAAEAWDAADARQRNRLARALFDAVIVRDGHIGAVRPRQEFQPYFVLAGLETTTPAALNGAAASTDSSLRRSRPDSNRRSHP